jgi:hypothetical protein
MMHLSYFDQFLLNCLLRNTTEIIQESLSIRRLYYDFSAVHYQNTCAVALRGDVGCYPCNRP